jgi:AAA domain
MTLQIERGVKPGPQRIGIFGPSGVGKTTLASQFPGSLILDTEQGSTHLPVDRIPITSLAQLRQVLRELPETDCQTVVIDTFGGIEKLLQEKICREKGLSGMEDLGYGKAWAFLIEEHVAFLGQLDLVRAAGINVVSIAHAVSRKVQYPGTDSFDRWEPRLYDKFARRWIEWNDHVLFLNFKIRVSNADGRAKGLGGRERVVHTVYDAAYDAKTRIPIAEELPLNFESIRPLLCGWERPPKVDPRPGLIEQLKDLDQEQLRAFLLDRKELNNGQALTEISVSYAREALHRLSEFREAVVNFDFIRMDTETHIAQPEQKGGE